MKKNTTTKNKNKFVTFFMLSLLLISLSSLGFAAAPDTPTPVITPSPIYTENDAVCTDIYVDSDADDGDMNFTIYVNSVSTITCNYAVTNGTSKTCTLNHINFHAGDVINCSLTVTDNTSATDTGSTSITVSEATSGTGMLGDSSSGLIGITKDIVSYIPYLVSLVIEIVPLLFIFVFVGWLTGLFDGILDMLNMSGFKKSKFT